MARETQYEGPSGIVGYNRYLSESEQRVGTPLVGENWYTARLVVPGSENIDCYAADILVRVMKVIKLPNGEIKVYAMPANMDGAEEADEENSVPMNVGGYFFEEGAEKGYLLDVFKRSPDGLGVLAAAAAMEFGRAQ